jgi:hypothetical protein
VASLEDLDPIDELIDSLARLLPSAFQHLNSLLQLRDPFLPLTKTRLKLGDRAARIAVSSHELADPNLEQIDEVVVRWLQTINRSHAL